MKHLKTVITYAVLALMLITVAFPLYYAVAGAFMKPDQLATYPPDLVPSGLHTDNFSAVGDSIPLGRQYLNSAIVASVVTVVQVLLAIVAAYAFVFLPLKWKSAMFGVFMATIMVPWEAILIPNYQTVSEAGLANTYFGLALPFLASGFGVFMLRQAYMQFPLELRDAAVMDGAGHWRFLWKILVPLNKPAVAAISIYVFLNTWNQYFWPLIITRTREMQTLQIGLSSLRDAEAADPGLILAGVSLSLIPTLLMVVFGQKFIVRGLTAGAVK